MSDWSNIWQGIGQLGQTRKGMYDPLRQEQARRGQVWKEGLGGISDTLGRIGDKGFQAGEAEKQRGFVAGESEKQREYEANEAELDRAIERQKMWQDWNIATMNNETLMGEADKDREHRMALQAAADSAEDGRQKERLLAQLDQYDRQLKLYYDQLAQQDKEFAAKQDFESWKTGGDWALDWAKLDQEGELGREGLRIREKEADAQINLLSAQLTEMKDPKAGNIWKEIKGSLIDDFSTLFQGVDAEGYAFESTLYDLARNDPDVINDIRAQFMIYAADYPDKLDTLVRLFDGAMGTMTRDASEIGDIPTPRAVDSDEQRGEAVGIAKDWLTQPAVGSGMKDWFNDPQTYSHPSEFVGEVKDWLTSPVLGDTKENVWSKLTQLLEAIPEIAERGGGSRSNPDRQEVMGYMSELNDPNTPTRRVQEISKAIKDLQEKYKTSYKPPSIFK